VSDLVFVFVPGLCCRIPSSMELLMGYAAGLGLAPSAVLLVCKNRHGAVAPKSGPADRSE
jgi:hypothetical protein